MDSLLLSKTQDCINRQFHQRFMRAFFVRKSFRQLFSSYILALAKCTKALLYEKCVCKMLMVKLTVRHQTLETLKNILIELNLSILAPRHTQHLCTQYLDKKIQRHFDKKIFFSSNIVVTFQNIFKLGFNEHNCPKINIFNSHRKNIG